LISTAFSMALAAGDERLDVPLLVEAACIVAPRLRVPEIQAIIDA
jgi:hypothetical protein